MDELCEDIRTAVRVCVIYGLQPALREILNGLIAKSRLPSTVGHSRLNGSHHRLETQYSPPLVAAVDECLSAVQLVLGENNEDSFGPVDSKLSQKLVEQLLDPQSTKRRIDRIVHALTAIANDELCRSEGVEE